MATFPCSGCGTKMKAGDELRGKKVACPQCGAVVRVPVINGGRRKHVVLLAALAFFAVVGLALTIAGMQFFWADKPDREPAADAARPSFVDVVVGNRTVAGIEDSGFSGDESNDTGPFRWTDGKARLVIPLMKGERPQALWLHLQRPKNTWLRIVVNDRELINEPITSEWINWWERTLDLGGIPMTDNVVVEIASNAMAPPGEKDKRVLGVKVRGVKLLRDSGKDPAALLDVTLGNRPVLGVDDAGFHETESYQGEIFRWTKGHGKLVIPLDSKVRPQALLVQLGWPSSRSVQIMLNGRELLNEKAPPISVGAVGRIRLTLRASTWGTR